MILEHIKQLLFKIDFMHFYIKTLLISILLNSCGVAYKTNNLNPSIKKKSYENIFFIKDTNNYSKLVKVGEFSVREKPDNWKATKKGMIDLAINNYANAILIKRFSLAGTLIKGDLYQVHDSLYTPDFEKECKVVLFRDEFGSILTTHFRTEISLDNNTKLLKDMTSIEHILPAHQKYFSILINGKKHQLELSSGSNYFWISRQIQSNVIGSGLSVQVGGQKIMKIDDPEKGSIWVSALSTTKNRTK